MSCLGTFVSQSLPLPWEPPPPCEPPPHPGQPHSLRPPPPQGLPPPLGPTPIFLPAALAAWSSGGQSGREGGWYFWLFGPFLRLILHLPATQWHGPLEGGVLGGLGHLGPVHFSSIFQHGKPHSSIRDSLIFKKFQNIRISKNVRFSEFFWISEFFSDFQNISDFRNFFKFLGFQKLPDFQFFKYLSEGQFYNNFT